MEDLEKKIQYVEQRISMLDNFIALSLRRSKISKELEQLALKVDKVRVMMTEVHLLMQNEFDNLECDYQIIMTQMRRKQMLVMDYLIKEKQKRIKEANEVESKVQLLLSNKSNSAVKFRSALPNSAMKLMGANFIKLNLNHELAITPKIKISEYKASPMVARKINPIQFQFVEFDCTITQQQFDTIPKYMCGRETLDQLNSFLATIIIPCFNEKYQLIHKNRSCLKNSHDLELWKLYNDQASSLPGRHFITPGDITRKLNKMLDKKSQNRLVMLRHIGIIQETRVKQTVFYIWCYNTGNIS